jgi:hypothetical protein
MLRGRDAVRADRRLRTDEKPSVRNRRSDIKPQAVLAVNNNRVFGTAALSVPKTRLARAARNYWHATTFETL